MLFIVLRTQDLQGFAIILETGFGQQPDPDRHQSQNSRAVDRGSTWINETDDSKWCRGGSVDLGGSSFHHFDEEQDPDPDPHHRRMSDPCPRQSEKNGPDPDSHRSFNSTFSVALMQL